ncbi:MAG: alpha/beta hydrolase [Dehalococcoidia bacterium]
MWDTSLLPLIPFAIDDIARGNTGVLSQVTSQLLFQDFGIATGMFWSVQCNEEWPFYTAAAVRAATEGVREEVIEAGIGGATSPAAVDELQALCEELSTPDPDAIERQAVTSSIPTLILAGEFDTNTPTEFGEVAAETLSNSYLIEVPSSGHFVTFPRQECTNPLIAAFFAAPQRRPDDSCVQAIPPVDFIVAGEEAAPSPTPAGPPTPPEPVGVITAPDTGTGQLMRDDRPSWVLSAMALLGMSLLVLGSKRGVRGR